MTTNTLFTSPLRCVINLGNALLAKPTGESASGVSVDISYELANELGVACELLVVNNAREAVVALESKQADIGFLAIDPTRAEHLQFTSAYLEIDGCYLVKENSHIQSIDNVDQEGHRVVVGLGSAYDLFLSREMKQASIIKADSSKEVVNTFLKTQADVAAGVKEQLLADMQTHKGLRMLPGTFMRIQQAMVLHRDAGPQAFQLVQDFANNCLNNGFIADSMKRHGITGARLVNQSA